jgi:DNA-binding transcriptional regulator GbsR (MarR family)
LQAALELAEAGIYVVPLHVPHFDNAGALVGCSCEAYKRSQKYKDWLDSKGMAQRFDPAFKCRTPGKHPRVSDWETEASTDPATIRAWFKRWPQLNLGIAPGKSGLLVVDGDKYKADYAGADLITQDDEQTATAISGNGGQHLYYQMPGGATYGNQTGDLPTGVDIRGHGGMVVVAPSIHPNGRPYQWEDGYSILECSPRPLPDALKSILDTAQTKSTTAHTVTFTVPTTEAPSLAQWHLSKATVGLIFNPAPAGKRSETDMSVVTSLCYAGATDDEILAVFEHCPIGVQGKFAEAGRQYLARTVGKARAYAEAHPRPDVQATIAAARLWIKTHSFEGFIPTELKKPTLIDVVQENGEFEKEERPWRYRTDSTDTKIADAILDVMEVAGMLAVNVGQKRLAKLSGINSPKTVRAALARLNGWLMEVRLDENGTQIALCEHSRFEQITPPSLTTTPTVYKGGQFAQIDFNEYSPHKADDAFASGVSGVMRDRFKVIAQAMGVTVKQAKQIDTETFAALGETCLRVRDAHARCGDMTASEAAEETGKKLSQIRSAYRKMEARGLVEAEREGARSPKVYSFATDFWPKVEELTPNLRTYKLADQRENKRLESAQQWTKAEFEKAEAAGEVEKAEELNQRFKEQAKKRIPCLTSLHPDLSAQDVACLAYEVSDYKRPPEVADTVREYRTKARTAHRLEVKQIVNAVGATMDAGVSKHEVAATVTAQGFSAAQVKAVLQSPRLMAQATTKEGNATLRNNIAELQATGTSNKEIVRTLEYAGFMYSEIQQALGGSL